MTENGSSASQDGPARVNKLAVLRRSSGTRRHCSPNSSASSTSATAAGCASTSAPPSPPSSRDRRRRGCRRPGPHPRGAAPRRGAVLPVPAPATSAAPTPSRTTTTSTCRPSSYAPTSSTRAKRAWASPTASSPTPTALAAWGRRRRRSRMPRTASPRCASPPRRRWASIARRRCRSSPPRRSPRGSGRTGSGSTLSSIVPRGRAALFYTCYLNYWGADAAIACAEVFNHNNIEVMVPSSSAAVMPFLDAGVEAGVQRKIDANLLSSCGPSTTATTSSRRGRRAA